MSERSIFLAALEIEDPAERSAYLERACAGDPSLRTQVEQLLRAHQQPGPFMEVPAAAGTIDGPINERPGTLIGPYKLLEQVGEGGMGAVFMAEQTRPVRRPVALKVIKPGMDSAQVIARFEQERQALALMDHPNIAKVLDAGTTESGRPYFVMELVKGVPITAFCDEHHLSPRERLELFLPVCQAVQHAHTKGIIHRDLKPSNVLVALYDDKPVPKVIDFGVAKATGEKLTSRTLFTGFGALVGTLEYMSPEQAKLNALDIDTRSDIYALGVLLYELLTGTTPLERGRLKQAALDEVLRLIREEEPPRPSSRLTALGEMRTAVSARRRTEPRRLSALLKGDLDCVVMRALEKDRTRRYETAGALAQDVRRFLAEEPVEARPPSAWERAGKWVRRRPAVAALLLLGVCSAVGILGAMAWGWQQALAAQTAAQGKAAAETRARQEADARKAAAQRAERIHEAGLFQERGTNWCERDDFARGLLWLARGLEVAPEDADDLQGPLRTLLGGWASKLRPLKAVLPHEGVVLGALFSPDGKTVLTKMSATPRPPNFERDGPHTDFSGCHMVLQLWDAATGKRIGLPISYNEEGQEGDVAAMAFSPDGKTILTATEEGTVRRWDAATGQPIGAPLRHLGHGAVFSPDGKKVLTFFPIDTGVFETSGSEARLWEIATGKLLHRIALLENGRRGVNPGEDWVLRQPRQTGFTADAKMFWIVDLIEVGNGAPVEETTLRPAFRLWDAANGKSVGKPVVFFDATTSSFKVAPGPDGKLLLTCLYDGIGQWDIAKGKPVGKPRPLPAYNRASDFAAYGDGEAFIYSPDGRTALAVGEPPLVFDLCDRPGGPWPLRRLGSQPCVQGAFSPGGKVVLTVGYYQNAARLWDAATGRPVAVPLRHHGIVHLAAFSPDGTTIVTADHTDVRLWAAPPAPLPAALHEAVLNDLRAISHDGKLLISWNSFIRTFSPDGTTILTAYDTDVGLWAVPRAPSPSAPDEAVLRESLRAISPDGKVLISWNFATRTIRRWDAATGKPLSEPIPCPRAYGPIVFSPNGKRVLIQGQGELLLWDPVTMKQIGRPIQMGSAKFQGGVFSADGKTFLAFGSDESGCRFRLCDAAAGTPLGEPWVVKVWFTSFASLSPDGKHVLIGDGASMTRIRDARTGKPVGPPLPVRGVNAGAFRPDGKAVVTVSGQQVQLWDIVTGRPLGEPLRDTTSGPWLEGLQPPLPIFSPDGRLLLLRDGSLWDMTTHRPLGVRVEAAVAGFTRDGTALLIPRPGPARFWPIPAALRGKAEYIRLWVEVNTGQELDAGGATLELDARAWSERWQRLQKLGGPP
jgi:serine/threonine protein kinase/WD40 repeat protein